MEDSRKNEKKENGLSIRTSDSEFGSKYESKVINDLLNEIRKLKDEVRESNKKTEKLREEIQRLTYSLNAIFGDVSYSYNN
jgi:predicted RNase H-like nuclease (RuvC/YqgF family)